MLDWFEKDAAIRSKFQAMLAVYTTLSALGLMAIMALSSGLVSTLFAVCLSVVS